MTLAAFAALCGADTKWVQNASRLLGLEIRYTEAEARRFGLVKRLHEEAGITLDRAVAAAGAVLGAADAGAGKGGWVRVKGPGVVALEVDVGRYLSDYEVRRASVRAHGQSKRRGRPPSSEGSAVDRAREAGLDISAVAGDAPGGLDGLPEAWRGLLSALASSGAAHVVIGGVAAWAEGARASTAGDDVDVCYRDSPSDRAALASLLAARGAELRGAEPDSPVVLDARTLGEAETLPLVVDGVPLDLFRRVRGIGGYGECLDRSREVRHGPDTLRVLELGALIESARATGRPRDHDRLVELEAVRELRGARS